MKREHIPSARLNVYGFTSPLASPVLLSQFCACSGFRLKLLLGDCAAR